jgi:hypothetical protein
MLVFSSKNAFAVNLVADLSWLITLECRSGYSSCMLGVYENGRLTTKIDVWCFEADKCVSRHPCCTSRLIDQITSAMRRGDKEFDVDKIADEIERIPLLGCD